MAFEYGAQKLNIRNPFRFEGMIRSARGLVLVGVGVYLLLGIQSVLSENKLHAWVNLVIGALFVAGGLKALGGGLFQVMRFFVGRAAPASLARNVAREAVNENEPTLYSARSLHNMLMSKSNPTFVEPVGWFGRAVHSIFPNLIVTPWPMRNMAQNLALKVAKSLVALVAFAVASLVLTMVFSSQETGETGSVVVSLMLQFVLLVYLGLVWARLGNPLAPENLGKLHGTNRKGLTMMVIGAIVVPILLAQLWNGVSWGVKAELAQFLPQLEAMFHTGSLLVLTVIGALAVAVITVLLIRARIGMVAIDTASSERNASWRYDLHPRQIFTTLRDLVLMDKRQQELPNRIYQDSNDTGQANRENEQFNGDLLVEIQPVAEELKEPGSLRWARITGTVLAQVFLLIGALIFLWVANRGLDHAALLGMENSPLTNPQARIELFLIPVGGTVALLLASLLLLGFGRTLARICHLFWAEVFFKSNLIDFHCEGTVMHTTHFRGADRHSASSEQDVFSFDATYFALAAEAVSSTFAVSGQNNLEQPRYLLSLNACDGFINSVIGDLENAFRQRHEEIQSDKQIDQEQRLDYIRREQEARRAGDMAAQGLVAPQQPTALEADPVQDPKREQISRWEGESNE
ncbi:hypothetical protein [Microbulbifer thermotolerans]|uniref:hypothetical protein n=1 Tax=Microbulbifer thermotolerans TaxID=252514 RepID=UPI00224A53A8|nr:hypothetical protein [Microbulbifer thermotolerans]MCX2779080.1 hypothetical protein [Microbulbifer thermotolerans]MCX2804623.1 hypothetical protein [Microbulbifer thermotolerans]MCX2842917.1 hypothetical protein [Microbulbifer thermotolerans]